MLLPLDAEVEGVHGLGHLLVGVLEHLDQLPRPQLVALLEEGVRCPRPARPSSPPDPGKGKAVNSRALVLALAKIQGCKILHSKGSLKKNQKFCDKCHTLVGGVGAGSCHKKKP